MNKYHHEEPITPTATWPLNHAKPDFVNSPAEEPACFTQEAEPTGGNGSDNLFKQAQAEKENPPIPHDDEELRRAIDEKEQTLEAIAEIPEEINTVGENCMMLKSLLLYN